MGNIFKGHACLTPEDRADGLSRKVGKKIAFYAAKNPKSVQISFTPRRKPVITHLQP